MIVLPALDPVPAAALQASLALIFLRSGAAKVKDLAWFVDALRAHRLLPEAVLWPAAFLIAVAEIGVAAALLFDVTRASAAVAALGLLAIFSCALGINLARGLRDIDCGCHGPAAPSGGISGWHLARNGALALAAILVALPVGGRVLVWADYATVAFATVALLFLFSAAEHLIAQAPRLADLRRTPHD